MHTRWVICLVAMIGLSVGAAAQERPARDSDKDVLSLEGKKGQGWIGAAPVTFHFRDNGAFVITGRMTGEGMWTQTGATVVMETARSTFKGTIIGNRVSGQRALKANRQSVDEWSALLSDTSLNEDDSMVAIWIIVAIVAGIVLVVLIGVTASVRHARIAADAQVKAAQLEADLKRDMLARGLTVEEIERLLTPKAPAVSRRSEVANALASAIVIMADANGVVDHDAVAGLLATFLEKDAGEEVEHLLTPKAPAVSRRSEEVNALASAIGKMVEGTGALAKDEVAGLLAIFLEKDAAMADRSGPSRPAKQTARGTQPDAGASEKPGREIHGILAGPLAAADRPRD